MSQNELVNLIVSSLSDVVLDEMVVELERSGKPRQRVLKVKKVATWVD